MTEQSRGASNAALHLKCVTLHPEKYPEVESYPFNLSIFQQSRSICFDTPVTLFVGENGTGKSTLLEAITQLCGIYIWRGVPRGRFRNNPYEDAFQRYISIQWTDGPVPGAFFGSSIFRHFAQVLDEWAATDPGQLDYFGGRSLTTLSHGQSLMAFFRSRCQSKGLFIMDEPETALSPRSQLELLDILTAAGEKNQAQFIIATHSPLLLACPKAAIYSFDGNAIGTIEYEKTTHYRIYKDFLEDRGRYIK